MEIIPKQGGGGLTQTHLFMFVYQVFLACQNHPEVLKNIFYYFKFLSFWDIFRKKRYFVEKIPILGEGGGGGVCPRGNFSHIIPFLFLKASLSSSSLEVFYCLFANFNFGNQRSAGQSAVLTLMDLQIETQIGRNWNNSSRDNPLRIFCQGIFRP